MDSISTMWKNSAAARRARFGLQRVLDDLSLPFVALKKSHLYLLTYTLGISLLTIWALSHLTQEWNSILLQTQKKSGLSFVTISRISLGSTFLLWVFSIPIFLTAAALPIRILWVHGTLFTSDLLQKTFSSIQSSQRALGLALRTEVRNLIPLAVMILIYIAFVRVQDNAIITRLYTLGLAGVCIMTLWKSLPIILSPLIAIVGQFDGRAAVAYSSQIVRPRALEFLSIALALVAVLLTIYVKCHGHRMVLSRVGNVELGLYLLTTWYGIALLSFKSLQAIVSATSNSTQQQQAAPQQPSAAQPTPSIHIENLWVTPDDSGGFKIKNPNQSSGRTN
ncbi:MAG: hypothetical protein J0M12_09270 [Deltaproteobacteria bacterium]|nr:hypothetical protein [Deltaproteobacteria bacterium]